MFKERKNLLIAGAALLIILLLASYFIFFNKSSVQKETPSNNQEEMSVKNLSPEAIGLDVKASADKKKIQIVINKLKDIKAVTYEITYEADSTKEEIGEGGEARIQRGITGDAKFSRGDIKYESPWLDLGSCSKNVCRYDQGVESVNIILKVTKADNSIYAVEKEAVL